MGNSDYADCDVLSYQDREVTHMRQTESITGTSTSTPTTLASAAGLVGPKRVIATAAVETKLNKC